MGYLDRIRRRSRTSSVWKLYLLMLTRAPGPHERLQNGCARRKDGSITRCSALFPEQSGQFKGINGFDSGIADPAIIECKVACPADTMSIDTIIDDLNRHDYCHAPGFHGLICRDGDEEVAFKRHWERLSVDENYRNYTRRERRFLLYRFVPGQPLEIDRNTNFEPTATYDVDYTPGVNRLTYAEDSFIDSAILRQRLETDIAILGSRLVPGREYTIDVHLFRIIAEHGAVSPTTSGIHQDGLEWVFMHFIDSGNIRPVVSEIHASKGSTVPLLAQPLTDFLDTVILNDAVLYHSANAVQQANQDELAFRNMLLISFSSAR
ncbi:2OG-Fe dioxygenase family protein [Burkholderia theae]|uniref:2OG-Fe dioxygenase family protein n=1 Tax=Burkholderia theae TaxID=3143496 RepID=UPI003AFB40EA